MKNLYKLLIIFFLIPIVAMGTNGKGKYTETKTISEEFDVNSDATLHVKNKYGNIDVISWNEQRIVMDIKITANGNDEEKVRKRLEEITVDFDANSSNVSATTIINKSSKSWSLWGKKNNVNIQIDYVIKIPITNNADLNNDYGGIQIDKLDGKATINCDYGSLNIGELNNSQNDININYTNKSNIDFIRNGKINADYSTLHVENSGSLELNADYTHLTFGSFDKLDFNCDYGSLKIDTAGSINGNCDYTHITINELNDSGSFNVDYGSIKVNELGSTINSLIVDSSYTQLKFGLNSNATFDITANLSYGGLKYTDGFTMNKEIVKSSSKYYEGYFGSQNSGNDINITSRYGNITFTNN
jgi:hypothetical protein